MPAILQNVWAAETGRRKRQMNLENKENTGRRKA